MAQNEGLGDKVLRYGKALLIGGGIFGVGKEAIVDIKHQEYQDLENMVDAFKKEDYKKVISISEDLINTGNIDENIMKFVKWSRAEGYFFYAIDNDDVDYIDKAENLLYNYGNEYGWNEDIISLIMSADYMLGKIVRARNEAIHLINADNNIIKSDAITMYKKTTNSLLENSFTNDYQYCERKYIYIGQNIQKIGGTYQIFDDERVIDWIFTLDQLPSDIKFPMGRPHSGLYMAHPVNTDNYYPMQTAEETLFMEKVNEFCWLVQCLGATEVSFHSNKGLSVAKGMSTSWNADGEVGVKGVKVGGGYGKTRKQDESNDSNKRVELVQHFTLKKKAYCPDDLIWLDSDPHWKMLIKQRLEGGIKEYNYKISSSETCQMSTNETNEVKANFEYMMYQVNANYNSSTDKTFSNTEETEWSIHVEFAPLEELKGVSLPNKNLSNDEQEYLDMLKDSFEDGNITARERKMLDRIRISLGISEERAKELESLLFSKPITENEREYIDIFKEYLEDGEITEKERRRLNKFAMVLGISQDRINELERLSI